MIMSSVELDRNVLSPRIVVKKRQLERRCLNGRRSFSHWPEGCGLHGAATWQGADTPYGYLMALYGSANLEYKKRLTEKLAGIKRITV